MNSECDEARPGRGGAGVLDRARCPPSALNAADATSEYADDSSVGNDEEVWRRIPADKICWDNALDRLRPQSGMFSDSGPESPMSAHRARCYARPSEAAGDDLMVALTAGFLRRLKLGVATEPPTDDPGHLWIFGKKTASTKKKLARSATWVIPPSAASE